MSCCLYWVVLEELLSVRVLGSAVDDSSTALARTRTLFLRWSQRLCGLSRESAVARLLGFWVRITPGAWMFVCCDCCVLSSRGPRDELITGPEESYRLWCVVECDLETLCMRRPWPTGNFWAKKKRNSLGMCESNAQYILQEIQGYYKRNRHFQRYVVSKPLA